MASQEASEIVQKIWSEMENWYRVHAPLALSELNEPARSEQIGEFEKSVNVSLPEDYKSSLRRHNGGGRIHGYEYLSLERSLSGWRLMNRLKNEGRFVGRNIDGGGIIEDQWWLERWVPVAEHRSGTMICIDMAPASHGVVGQVLQIETHDEGAFSTEYKSFTAWLVRYKEDLYNGLYYVDEFGYLNKR